MKSDMSYEDLITPRIEMDCLSKPPFSESFSGIIELADGSPPELSGIEHDLSYDVEHFKNIKILDPDWQHDEIEEIMVLSSKPKSRLRKFTEESEIKDLGSPQPAGKSPIGPSDFDILHVLGNGVAAHVCLASKKDTNRLYAIKSILRSVPTNSAEMLALETVTKTNAPFLPHLFWSFCDSMHLYLVMEFHPGGDLLTHLKRDGPFSPDRARFYASEIAEGISTIHATGIIHQDLKPENIMIDAQGHIVLTDFGCAKVLQSNVLPHRTSTSCGTREYQAPEVLLGWAYDFAVDCWGFGVLLYLMLCGTHPFMDSTTKGDLSAIHVNILRGPTLFSPSQQVDAKARNLIEKCMERNSAVRLNIKQIKAHGYFISVDWKQVSDKSIQVPYIPMLDRTRIDLSYFDKDITDTPLTFVSHNTQTNLASLGIKQTGALSKAACHSKTVSVTSRGISRPKSLLHEYKNRRSRMAFSTATIPSIEEEQDEIIGNDKRKQARTEREIQEFWDNISLEGGSPMCSSSGTAGPPSPLTSRTHKLRKRQTSVPSFRPLDATKGWMGVRQNIRQKVSRLLGSSREQHTLELPKGIVQVGSGIGFTRSSSQNTQGCSPFPGAPKKFLFEFPLKIGKRIQKAKSHFSPGLSSAVTDTRPKLTGASDVSVINLSFSLAHAAIDSPESVQTPVSMDREMDENEATVGGGPDTTLRLVAIDGLSFD